MSQNCALCSAETELNAVALAPRGDEILLCETCNSGLGGVIEDLPHWQCLHEAIWSTDPATQVAAYRILSKMTEFPWARDLLEIAYLESDVLEWAQEGLQTEPDVVHRDCNGVVLSAGDTVVLIKDLNVKGAGFTAKRGTAVRNISLDLGNENHIEGRVESQKIVILTQFVKKS